VKILRKKLETEIMKDLSLTTVENCLELLKTVEKCSELLKAVQRFLKLMKNIQSF
jgi:hypothetical protein